MASKPVGMIKKYFLRRSASSKVKIDSVFPEAFAGIHLPPVPVLSAAHSPDQVEVLLVPFKPADTTIGRGRKRVLEAEHEPISGQWCVYVFVLVLCVVFIADESGRLFSPAVAEHCRAHQG